MKYKHVPILICLALGIATVPLTGCKTTPTVQKQSVNTLFTLHKTADAALDGYLDSIHKGVVATNDLPAVLRAYTTFQTAYNAAVNIVAANTNGLPTQAVQDAAASFATAIATAKSKTP
jgi:hypothetical protein